MENKVKFGETEFTLKEQTLGILDAFAEPLADLEVIKQQYRAKLDTKDYDKAVAKIREIEKAISQIKDNPDKKTLCEKYEKDLDKRYEELEVYAPLVEVLNKFSGLAFNKWIASNSVRNAFKSLIQGDVSKIIWDSDEIIPFMTECFGFFFKRMNLNK